MIQEIKSLPLCAETIGGKLNKKLKLLLIFILILVINIAYVKGATFGQFSSVSSSYNTKLDVNMEYECQRFNSTKTGDVTAISFNLKGRKGFPKITIGLMADNGGNPSGTWLTFINKTINYGVSDLNISVPLITINQGTVYHFCWYCDSCSSSKYISLGVAVMDTTGDNEFYTPSGIKDTSFRRERGVRGNFKAPSVSSERLKFAINVSSEWKGLPEQGEIFTSGHFIDIYNRQGQRFRSLIGKLNISAVSIKYSPVKGTGQGFLYAQIRNTTSNEVLGSCQLKNITKPEIGNCTLNRNVIISNNTFYNLILECPRGCGNLVNNWKTFGGTDTFSDGKLIDYYSYDGANSYMLISNNNFTKTTKYDSKDMYFSFEYTPVQDSQELPTNTTTSNVSVYLVPYVGDIDGSIDPDWFFFYDQLRQWHDDNNIPIGLSFYPGTMDNNEFNQIIGNMYSSKNVELILKGESSSNGTPLDMMSYSQVKSVIQEWQNKYITELEKIGYSNVTSPVSYNQLLGRFTETIRDATHDLGFKVYFDQYVSEYGHINPLPDYDVIQYSVSLTISGQPGPGEAFKQPEQVIEEIIAFNDSDMLYINGTKVVSLMSHQQDFMMSEIQPIVNQQKWNIYTTTLLMAKNDSRIKFLKPAEIYNLRHPVTIVPTIAVICDWQDCHRGAASVSIDDSFSSCRDKLNQKGFKGTYYLSETSSFDEAKWNLWRDIYAEKHEIGGHTQSHSCLVMNEPTLRQELGSNINDILTNIPMPREDLSSFAWPCGINNEEMKTITSEYYVSARGYHINQLEDKDPADFMNIKSLNTPGYHDRTLEPPSYFMSADDAETRHKWVNFVFHNECQDNGSIDYLATKDLWVAPVGKVAKYIKERQNAKIQNLVETDSEITFNLVGNLSSLLFNQNISIKVFVNSSNVQKVEIDNVVTSFKRDGSSIRFNVNPSGVRNIRVVKGAPLPECGNSILESGEQCDDGNLVNGDGCSNLCTIETFINLCNFAISANATSSNTGSEPIYATGAPDADIECSIWSGTQKSWNPTNWNVKANITLSYPKLIMVKNFTIFGDYDICWNRMWLKNNATAEQKLVYAGPDNTCILTKKFNDNFLADTIILETCGWAWTSTDAVEMCGVIVS